MNRRDFLGLLAGSFAAAPVLGMNGLIPQGLTRNRIRPIGDFPVKKVRWTRAVPMVDQACIVGKLFLDVEHDCACGWTASGMYAIYSIKEAEIRRGLSQEQYREVLELKQKNALLCLQDVWETTKTEPFLNHYSCPKIVGAWREAA